MEGTISFFISTLAVVHCAETKYTSFPMNELLDAAGWESLVLLCDTKANECPAEEVLSVHPALYLSMDLTNHSVIVQMFETYAAPTQLNWLVFCTHCEILLDEINIFEQTHDLQGYLTYKYQWILVSSNTSYLEESLGKIMNLIAIDKDQTAYMAMFGMKRYFQEIKKPLGKHPLQKTQVFPNSLTGMNNITLTFSVLPWATYITKDSSGSYHGYYIELMDMIANELNFTFHITKPSDGNFGTFDNGIWTGMIGQLVNKKVDIALPLTLSYIRNKDTTQMTVPVTTGHNVVVYHKPDSAFMSADILVKPFTSTFWFIFVCSLGVTIIVFHVSENMVHAQHHSHTRRENYGAYILRSTLNQGTVWSPVLVSTRIISSFYSFSWIILTAQYTASIVALLSVKKEVVPFHTMDELSINNEYKLGIMSGTRDYELFYNTNFNKSSPFYQLNSKLVRDAKHDPSVLSKDFGYHHNKLLTEKYAFITTQEAYDQLASMSCKIGLLKEKGSVTFDGFTFQNNSAYANDFDVVVSRIQEGNLDFYIRKQLLHKHIQCSTSHSTVSLENIHGVFYILFGGLGLSTLFLLGEVVYHCFSQWICNRVHDVLLQVWHLWKYL